MVGQLPSRRFFICYLGAILAACFGVAHGQKVPEHYVVPEITLSPDHKYGVTVPITGDLDDIASPANQIIELKTGHLLGAIAGQDIGLTHMNHDEIRPALWSDNSLLLWQIDGKWGFASVVLVKIGVENIDWQIDLLSRLQQEMLHRTRQAVPDRYAKVKAAHADWGSWYKDGFAIDCVFAGPDRNPLAFPLLFHCYLSSDVKGIEPDSAIDARMTAEVNDRGEIRITDFHTGTKPPARTW